MWKAKLMNKLKLYSNKPSILSILINQKLLSNFIFLFIYSIRREWAPLNKFVWGLMNFSCIKFNI